MDDFTCYGHSLFETLLARAGCFRLLHFHWYRLQCAAPALDLVPPDWHTFLDSLETVPTDGDFVTRLTLLRLGGRWSDRPQATNIDLRWRPWIPQPTAPYRLMIDPHPLPQNDPLRRFKCGNRLVYQQRLATARKLGFDDMLLIDRNQHVLETTLSNLCVELEGEWLTPPLQDSLLPGTMRGHLIEEGACRAHPIRYRDLFHASAIAVTNAVHGAVPVEAIHADDGTSHLFPDSSVRQLTTQAQNAPFASLAKWRQSKPDANFRPWPAPSLD